MTAKKKREELFKLCAHDCYRIHRKSTIYWIWWDYFDNKFACSYYGIWNIIQIPMTQKLVAEKLLPKPSVTL